MPFWDALAEGGVTGVFKGVGELAKDLRAAFSGKEVLSSEQQAELLAKASAIEAAAQQMEANAAQGQIDINKIDAQSGSLFKGGWRPSIGWMCVFGLFYSFLIRPILPWLVSVFCLIIQHVPGAIITIPAMPELDIAQLMALVMSLLGFGGYRMYEKIRGVASR